MMKYEMKEIWNWKQVEIILWKEQRDRERKEISEEKRREMEESNNDIGHIKRWYQSVVGIYERDKLESFDINIPWLFNFLKYY